MRVTIVNHLNDGQKLSLSLREMSNVWGVRLFGAGLRIQRLRNELVADKNVVAPVTTCTREAFNGKPVAATQVKKL